MPLTSYSFTEKKRIRKSFAKRASVLPVPFLLETQLASYRAFLQADTASDQRKNEGRQAACTSIFPISSHSGSARLEFVGYSLLPPAFDVTECQQRGLTYCSALRAKVRLIIMDKEAPKETVKEVKEQEVYMGEIPLMTGNGSFVITAPSASSSRSCTAAPACSSSTTAAKHTARASSCFRRGSFPTAARGWTSSSIPRTTSISGSTGAARCR